jgi:dihydrofolate reductase
VGRHDRRDGDLTEEIARLKRQPGKDILAHGGAGFARALSERRLIDEYRLFVHPSSWAGESPSSAT